MQADSFLAKGMWRNSLGPWALEWGPSTPVTTNWVPGNFSPSMAMKGIEPPSPWNATGLPNAVRLALFSEASSQGAKVDAFQPLSPRGTSNTTSASYGGVASSAVFIAVRALSASRVGGKRSDSLAVE